MNKEGHHDEEKFGSRNICAQEVLMWTNLIHLGLGFWVLVVVVLTHFGSINMYCKN
jgi:hypothetical protein